MITIYSVWKLVIYLRSQFSHSSCMNVGNWFPKMGNMIRMQFLTYLCH